jgi:hypothetical protein
MIVRSKWWKEVRRVGVLKMCGVRYSGPVLFGLVSSGECVLIVERVVVLFCSRIALFDWVGLCCDVLVELGAGDRMEGVFC